MVEEPLAERGPLIKNMHRAIDNSKATGQRLVRGVRVGKREARYVPVYRYRIVGKV